MSHVAIVISGLLALADPGFSGQTSKALEAYESVKAEAGRDSGSQLRVALWCEAHGLGAERVKHLALAVLHDPKNATARGLMGLLAYRGKWETPDAVSAKIKADEAMTARLAAYNARRDQIEAFTNETRSVGSGTRARQVKRHSRDEIAAEHVKLGMWCELNGLKAEANAHFTQAVVLDPYRDQTWKHLGYSKHDGRWMSRDQIKTEQRQADAQRRADRYWDPLLKKWRGWLAEPARADEARTELSTVTDPLAVPAVTRVFAEGNEANQQVALRLFGQIDDRSATLAITRMAVLGASEPVRTAAAELLLRRELRDFAGLLADQIHTPMKYRVQPVGGPGSPGALLVEAPRFRMFRAYDAPPLFRPGTNWHGYVGFDPNGMPIIAAGREITRLSNEGSAAAGADLARIESRTQALLAEANLKAAASQQRLIGDINDIETANGQARALNQRIAPLLRQALEAPAELKDDDEDGWHRLYYDKIGYRYTPPEQITLTVDASPQYPPPTITSCFVAGTPVHTMDGRKPIETLRVGDQVLTQSVSDGALSFQPVLVVHRNAPAATIAVGLDNGETIVASTFHRFWRVGRGWAMAKELQTGDILRTLAGASHVVSLGAGPTVPVFNLDTAQTRTFFVGQKDALVHDNTLPDPRLKPFDAVPGEDKP